MSFSIQVDNISSFKDSLQKAVEKQVKIKKNEAYILAKEILNEAIRLCPKNTGYLASTGKIVKEGSVYKVVFTASYAVYVHEDLSVKHTSGQAKFLTQAVINVKRARGMLT